MENLNFNINSDEEGQRIDKYLSIMIEGKSRSFVQGLIDEKKVKANNKVIKSNYKNRSIQCSHIIIFGVFLFLILWEARSRYIYILIPIFSILAGKGCVYICDISIMNIIYKIKNRMKGKRKNEENISSHTNVL